MKPSARRDWDAGIRALHAETGGIVAVMLITPAGAVALIADAAAGDVRVLAYLRSLETFQRRIEVAGEDAPLCLTCDRRLGNGGLLGLVVPARSDATRCLAIGFCATCAAAHRDRAAAEAAATAALRRMLWPDLRPIPRPSRDGGRA